MVPVVRTSHRATARTPWAVRALDAFGDRSVGQLLSLWLGVVLTCGLLYWLADVSLLNDLRQGGAPVGHGWRDFLTAEYFSFVTATSVGFGDVVPTGLSRVLAVVEAMAGLVIFGSLISKFVSRRQDRIIAEIHQTTVEEGLARVRTNLHLVFTELQNIETSCEQRGWPAERMLIRVESAALVLVGELRIVRGLLYRPRQLPQETDLEGILVGVTLALQQLIDLLGNVPAGAARPQRLEVNLTTMAALARDICGECVPRAYEPHMVEWMDRIQGLAGRLTAA
ncbi:MAG: two pore domain potassium channel family protein [Acidobacteriota bacterium]|nr:two pore domain potassium channel family protein [Acidobacteriota bacterium]